MKERMTMALLFPVLAILTVVIFAGGLGVIFMLVESTALGAWGVVLLGMALVVGVPTATALLQWVVERE